MKNIILSLAATTSLMFIGCGSSSDSSTPPNDNIYNLRAINTLAPLSGLLNGSYSNGTTGSIFFARSNIGNDFVNGVSVVNIKSDTSITLDNGYTSQASAIAKIDANGFTLELDDTLAYCTLTTTAEVIPTNAKIGATSSGTSIYSCNDSTNRTMSWKLTDAGNGNAYYIFNTVISGALQSENATTLTITPENKIIHYKVYVNVIAQGITGTFEGNVN